VLGQKKGKNGNRGGGGQKKKKEKDLLYLHPVVHLQLMPREGRQTTKKQAK